MNHAGTIAAGIMLAATLVGLDLAQASKRPCDVVPLTRFEIHDGDTFTHCDVSFPWGVALTDRSIRVAKVDACEVTKTRQTVTVTDAEIIKGKECRDKLRSLANGAKAFVRPTGESVYGRLEADVYLLKSGEWINVAEWVRSNGYER